MRDLVCNETDFFYNQILPSILLFVHSISNGLREGVTPMKARVYDKTHTRRKAINPLA
ncbi:hypothetical protein [Lacticaseibacillus paracasei]|uniref:Uncharacterized protein n=1 Tax=Lacticaseibacillus paracasei subsp. paracasei TaxID=47714 RepID=A0AAP9KWM0_LACPA|nr:hypothetical protein [Lacticaseibacillus paracasei]MDH7443593.1 hypothetical protein [Lacticaseibacillus paracasei subsp. paracasei]QGV19427.1 Hypothetical protein LCAKO_2938 [Lacticaseibacillus paracasei subsp. paracasei]UVD34719.1 hypothetical protein MUB27_13520 [Lacticaseibacillus paracasei]